jgi:glycosyltransferase involved in cell wall biosynthesis
MQEQLTIVIPVRNRAELVVRTLNSVAASVCCSFRLIVVDNGSTDQTGEVLQRWAASVSGNLDVELLSEPRGGAPAARNRGLEACQTPWVYFFDSDDIFDEHFVGAVMKVLEAGGDALDVVLFPVEMEVNGTRRTRSYEPTGDAAVHILNSMLSTQTMVLRTQWLRELGGWNEELRLWQDWELGVRALAALPRWRWCSGRAFHRVVVHDESITGRGLSDKVNEVITAMETALEDVRKADWMGGFEKERMELALWLRAKIVAGKMAREGSRAGRQRCHEWSQRCEQRVPGWMRIAGEIMEWYTRYGGRGAWRLARRILPPPRPATN